MILQWTSEQVHDTVAAIAAQTAYRGERRSLLARLLRIVLDKINQLLDWVRGSLDAKVIVIAAIAVVVLIVAARIVIDRRAAARRTALPRRGRAGEARDAWTEARTLAAAGRFADASHAVYFAVVEALTAAGVVRFHRSKTAGDYARELRRAGAPVAADFRAFGRDFDRVAFGVTPAAREDYEQLVAMAERIIASVRRAAAA